MEQMNEILGTLEMESMTQTLKEECKRGTE